MTSVEKNWMFIFGKNRLQCLNLLVLVACVLVLISFHASSSLHRHGMDLGHLHAFPPKGKWAWAVVFLFIWGLPELCLEDEFRHVNETCWCIFWFLNVFDGVFLGPATRLRPRRIGLWLQVTAENGSRAGWKHKISRAPCDPHPTWVPWRVQSRYVGYTIW